MSYSFNVYAANKADAKTQLAAGFDTVVAAQPSHAADREAALAVGNAFIDLVVDPDDGHEIVAALHGGLGWRDEAQKEFTSASVGASAHVRKKPNQQ